MESGMQPSFETVSVWDAHHYNTYMYSYLNCIILCHAISVREYLHNY